MPVRLHRRSVALSLLLCLAAFAGLDAQSPRDRTRLKPGQATAVNESQASELTLTLTTVDVRPIQVWIRTAGTIAPGGRTITATVPAADARRIRIGQRVRAFPPESRSSMYQAFVGAVRIAGARASVVVELSNPAREGSTRYLLEIVTDDGDRLSVPNEALIERGGKHLVYVQQEQGKYLPREIQVGVQGELFTEVVGGLQTGEQVVTFGSFFIDAEHTLKGSP